jgi:hypothetical protein
MEKHAFDRFFKPAFGYATTDGSDWSRAVKNFLQFFQYGHLPNQTCHLVKKFHDMALHLIEVLPSNPESTVAMRKLMEAKDCAVRSVLFKSE